MTTTVHLDIDPDELRGRIIGELTGWPIGQGRYTAYVTTAGARTIADRVVAILRERPGTTEGRP